MDRCEQAVGYHKKGFNCCQSVLAAFQDVIGLTETQCLTLGGGFGAGAGTGELCGAVTGAVMVLDLLTRLCHDYSTTVVIITHNASIAPLGNRLIRMRNGSVQEMTVNEHPAKVADITW